MRELLEADAEGPATRLHDVSRPDRAVMLEQLEAIRDGVRADAARLAKRLKRAHARADRAYRQVQQVPDDKAVAPMIEELQQIERDLGSVDNELERGDDELRQAEHELKVAERERRRVEEAAAKAGKGAKSAELALRTVGLLE